jgi:hypothetical protein
MRLIPIFVEEGSMNGIWSIRLEGQAQNELDAFLDAMNDSKLLDNFFDKNIDDLTDGFFGDIPVDEAIELTLEEAEQMEEALYYHARKGFDSKALNLQHLFKPLNNQEYYINTHQKSKGRIKRGWLRLYAIRIEKNCYVVTGGAIKLTKDMRREHLQYELKKLDQTKSFLRNNGINFSEDLKIIV